MENLNPVNREIFFSRIIDEESTCQYNDNTMESLAFLKYDQERNLKDRAFKKFLQKSGISVNPQPLIASPKPRNYRTTTKRRVLCDRHGIGLGFSQNIKKGDCAESQLEPEEHQEIYHWLLKTLNEKSFSSLARALNWVIIRGNYDRRFLIFNIYKMDGGVVRKLKQISTLLQKDRYVEGAMAYFDPKRSEYYLETEKAPHGIQTKHLFGTRLLGLKINDILMRYSPTSFSQVNESIIPKMIEHIKSSLHPQKGDHLIDLYCGYGLFSHTVGTLCAKVTSVEINKDSIESARQISKRLKTRGKTITSK